MARISAPRVGRDQSERPAESRIRTRVQLSAGRVSHAGVPSGVVGGDCFRGKQAANDLFIYVQLLLPPAAYQVLVKTLLEVTQNAVGGKLTFGLLFALLTGSGGMTQLMSTLNAAYEVRESRSWLKVHLISMALTIAMSMLMVAALFLVLFGGEFVGSFGQALESDYGRVRYGEDSAVGAGAGLRSFRFRDYLLFCSGCGRTTLVLDHAGLGRRSLAVGGGFRRPGALTCTSLIHSAKPMDRWEPSSF